VRPLDSLASIKTKLGVVIVAAVAVTVAVVSLGVKAGAPLLLLGALAGALALAMVQFLAHGMTSPLRQMSIAARAMARGDYDRRVTATSRDEVGELARAFNRMAADLAEVDRMRRDLVANVSHELRTPIAALQTVLENILDGVQSPTAETLETMLAQVQRLAGLVTQLLDLSRLESGAAPLQMKAFSLRPLLDQTVREATLHERNVSVAIEMASDLMAVADPERLHQVLANLVENAIRHSPEGGAVTLRALVARDRIVIEVADQGPGIPARERARIFERFYRSDASRAAADGFGLGLAIARWIVDLHGGEIRVEDRRDSTGRVAGCLMVVELPRRAA
jgi:signal transduction histidine kinase